MLKVFYVWFDAPIGYMSMTKCYLGDNWRSWWESDTNAKVTYYQFMAKDNVPFHSIMFPSSLIASGRNWNLVNHLMATGNYYLTCIEFFLAYHFSISVTKYRTCYN